MTRLLACIGVAFPWLEDSLLVSLVDSEEQGSDFPHGAGEQVRREHALHVLFVHRLLTDPDLVIGGETYQGVNSREWAYASIKNPEPDSIPFPVHDERDHTEIVFDEEAKRFKKIGERPVAPPTRVEPHALAVGGDRTRWHLLVREALDALDHLASEKSGGDGDSVPQTGRDSLGSTDGAAGRSTTTHVHAPSASDRSMALRFRRALAALQTVESERPDFDDLPMAQRRREQHAWLVEHDPEGLPKLQAWKRYVSEALRLSNPRPEADREPREPGRSIVRRDAI